ncbi:hypothetical protein SEA_YAHALOM_16 [Mycobacterium phage Yahalom]|nr:hypothetical protein SEA_YAHALOM_16 [Mycobacterium phage Yahalom]
MPAGIEVVVEDGFATIDFLDPKLKGPALGRLIESGGPGVVEPLTREKGSPRKRYRVPEGNAREAGLLDEAREVDALVSNVLESGVDAHGSAPDLPTSANAHSQTTRSGSYSAAYGGENNPTPEVPAEALSTVSVAVGAAQPWDEPAAPKELPVAENAYPEGEPDDEWTRPELNAYATDHGIEGAANFPNKAALLKAIKDAE